MLILVLVGLVYIVQQYVTLGHLPRPFNSDPSQSLMDFYNTAYWSHRPGAYEIWHTVYPPLSFLFAQIVTNDACYVGTAYDARTCDPAGAGFIMGFYLLNTVLVFLSLRRSRAAAVPRTLALCLGLPMLYGLELANLIIPCFTLYVLAEGGLLKSRWARHLFRGLAFNFKLYLLVVALPSALQRRVGWLIVAGVTCLTIYLVTLVVYRSGTPWDIFTDLVLYSRDQSKLYFEQNHLAEIASKSNDIWNRTLPAILRLGEAIALTGLASGLILKDAVSRRRLTALALTTICAEAAIHTQGFSADYTQIFLIFLIFREREWSITSSIVIVMAYLLCVTADIALVDAYREFKMSFLSGRLVEVEFGLTASQFVRPLLIVMIQMGLTGMLWRKVIDNSNRPARRYATSFAWIGRPRRRD
ncbi:MAG: hypothetical protein Q8L23_00620 [Caulobacter sp.]|nr:hypothetical protein [Caulobacter sp.]